jgi:hypothetical protein
MGGWKEIDSASNILATANTAIILYIQKDMGISIK